jgi:uncharacterized protein YjbI with pentapeptide repeats
MLKSYWWKKVAIHGANIGNGSVSLLSGALHALALRFSTLSVEQDRTPEQLAPPQGCQCWTAYWKTQGQPWRTEPEIELGRQRFLAKRRKIAPDFQRGVYPFKDLDTKLTRADIEWLLATHESDGVRGPVDWSDPNQRSRRGLDLRGADLSRANLRGLPLSRLVAGFDPAGFNVSHWRSATADQREAAAVHLEGANLHQARLEEASLWRAYFMGAHLEGARLEGALLSRAHLEGANLSNSYLAGADITSAFFDNQSSLRDCTFGDTEYGFVSVADTRWSGVNLALVQWPTRNWEKTLILGDEQEIHPTKQSSSLAKGPQQRLRLVKREHMSTLLTKYQAAVRANRQLAVELHEQGLNELASFFFHRAQVLQRHVFRLQRKHLSYAFSLLLDALSGYGYKPGRGLLAYLLVIVAFAFGYYVVTHTMYTSVHELNWHDSLVLSISSFHGRGFFSFDTPPRQSDPTVVLAAVEAVFGLLIEVTFIATFTQRFFGR